MFSVTYVATWGPFLRVVLIGIPISFLVAVAFVWLLAVAAARADRAAEAHRKDRHP